MQRNPFRFGSPVTAAHFCNRTSELAQVESNIRSANSLWLYAPRRYGKTSLIKEAFRRTDDDISTAFVDLYGVTDAHGFVSAWLAAVGPLLDDLSGGAVRALQHIKHVLTTVTPQLALTDEGTPVFSLTSRLPNSLSHTTVAEALRTVEAVARRTDRPVVVACDEFQEIAAITGLEAVICQEIQHYTHTSFIFSGSRRSLLQAMFTERSRPFFEFAAHMTLDRLPYAELHAHLSQHFTSTNRHISDQLVADIVAASAGHPHYAQYFSALAWELLPQVGEEALAKAWRDRVVAGLDPVFRMVFDRFSTTQRRVLQAMTARGGVGLHADAVRAELGLGSSSTVAGALQALVERDFVELRPGKRREYSFVNPSFALWLSQI